MQKFEDFYKPCKKLFEDDYKKDPYWFQSKTKSGKDLSFEFNGKTKDDALESNLKWVQSGKLTVGSNDFATKVTGKVHHYGGFECELESENAENGVTLLVKGGLETTDNPNTDLKKEKDILRDNVSAELQYSHKSFKGTLGGAWRKRTDSSITVTANGNPHTGLTFGASAKFLPLVAQENIVDDVSAGFSYSADDVSILVHALREKGNAWKQPTIKVGAMQTFSKTFKGGIEYKHDLKKNSQDFLVAAECSVDDSTTVKAKVAKDTTVNVAYITNLNKDLKANFTLTTKLSDLKSGTGGSNVCVGFTYEPK